MAADSAYNSKKAYISETHMKVKHMLMHEPATIHGLKGEFLWTERQLGLFLALLEDKEGAKGTCSELQFDHEFDLAINASNVVDDFIRERGGQTGHVFDDFSSLRKFNKELNRFKTRMHDFCTTPSILGHEYHPDLNLLAASSTTVPDKNQKEEEKKKLPVVGLEVDVQVLSRVLIHDEHKKVIFIVGEKGIGKTTLSMEVHNNTVLNHHFQIQAWVNVSKGFERRDVLQNIMKKIPEQFMTKKIGNSSSTQELAQVLHHVLSTARARCLIVLDGLRTPKAWKALREILPLTWSRIMITTRCRDLAKVEESREQLVHEMRTLSDQEGWELFNAKVHVPIQLEQVGEKIVRKCSGFPLEILTVGEILTRRDATEDQWLKVLNEYVDPRQKLVLNINAAADALPPNLKDCLSSLELFHEEYEIPMRRLIVYWVAEGLVKQESGSYEAPEDLAEKYLMEFIQDNLIQAAKWKLNGKLKTCRVNYFLRDSWLAKAKKEKFLNDNNKKAASLQSFIGTDQILLFGMHLKLHDNRKKAAAAKSSSGTVKIPRLADHLNSKEKSFLHIHGNDRISSTSFRQYYGDLRSFVSFDTREGPVPGEDIGNFLRGGIAAGCFKLLRVVDFEGAFRPKLPDSIGKLTQLRYLGLRRTYLEVLPSSIGKLLNLQTLDLKHSCIKSLPSSIWKLQQLRHLYLTASYRSKIEAPARTSSLVEMQTLWGAFVDEETHIEDSLYRSINLRKLGLGYRLTLSQQKVLAEWISKLKNLESLRLTSIDDMVRPSTLYLKPLSGLNKLSSIYLLGKLDNPAIVHEFPVSLTEITLSISGLKEDPMPKLEKLPNLRILNLYASSYTDKIMVCSSGGFSLLRVLNLWKLEALEEWIVEDGALTILRDLEIRSCVNLKMIPEGLKHLGHCHELKLTKMTDDFKARVIANQGIDWHKIAHIPSVVINN